MRCGFLMVVLIGSGLLFLVYCLVVVGKLFYRLDVMVEVVFIGWVMV